jgi:hypothetical protein
MQGQEWKGAVHPHDISQWINDGKKIFAKFRK